MNGAGRPGRSSSFLDSTNRLPSRRLTLHPLPGRGAVFGRSTSPQLHAAGEGAIVKWQSVAVLGLAVLWAKSGLGQVPPDPQSVLLSNNPRTVPPAQPALADTGAREQLHS